VRVVDDKQLQVGIEGGPTLRRYAPIVDTDPVCA
jgi:hypothetical protein